MGNLWTFNVDLNDCLNAVYVGNIFNDNLSKNKGHTSVQDKQIIHVIRNQAINGILFVPVMLI